MTNLLDMLFSFYNSALKKDAFFDIAAYLLSHIQNIDEITLKDITNNCYTSATTVNKFCQMFEYPNFNLFKHQLKTALYMKKLQLTVRIEALNPDHLYNTYLSLCHNDCILSKEELFEFTSHLADLIYKSDKAIFYTSVFPAALISNFQYDMCFAGKFIRVYSALQGDYVQEMTSDDVMFIVSFTGAHLSTKVELFNRMCTTNPKKIIISQRNYDIDRINNGYYMFNLPNDTDCVESNYVLMLLFDLVRYFYYTKYYFRKEK